MGKLYKRPGSPYFWAWWYDAQGRRCRESTKSADRRVASLWLSAREAETIKESAGVPVARRVALADAMGQYLDAHVPPVWSADWHYTVGHWLRSRILPELGGPDAIVGAVGRGDAERARSAWLAELEPPTVNRLNAVASGFFRWAADPARRYTLENPFAGHKRFAEVKRHPPQATPAQLEAFLAAFRNPHVKRAAVVSMDTGLRLSELRRIRLEDVDEGAALLRVVSSYARGHTKTRRERVIPLTPRALAAILAGDRPDPFTSVPLNVRKALRAAQRAAGLPPFRWHDLRHYALTAAANAGLQGHDLTLLAGWSSMAMADRYIHSSVDRIRAALGSSPVTLPAAKAEGAGK